MVVAAVHIALVAPHYHIGSFDDDAAYILGARGLLHGTGLTGLVTGGRPLVGYYPPGFAALLAPLVAVVGGHLQLLRALPAACAVALLPLTWWYLGRHRIGDATRFTVLMLMALNPVLATFGSMIMAEAPFLVLFVCWLALADRWQRSPSRLGGVGLATIAAGAGLVWLKQAGIGMVAGLIVWQLVRRTPVRAALNAAGTTVLLAPVIIARAIAGVPLAGARYSTELGTYYQGGAFAHLGTVIPHALNVLLSQALPQTLIPLGSSPLPVSGPLYSAFRAWAWSVPVLCILGALVWLVRYRDAAFMVVAIYTGEVLLYPFINERRVILALPLVVAWYVLGGVWLLDAAVSGSRWLVARLRGPVQAVRPLAVGGAVLTAVALLAVPLAWQAKRDYLFPGGQSSSSPLGSRYADLLARLGTPSQVVETDYVSTVALATGHRTHSTAFQDTTDPFTGLEESCRPQVERSALVSDHAAFLLTGNLNKPYLLDSPCLFKLASAGPWAVELLHTARDHATVFELVGPGTPHPHLASLLPSAAYSRTADTFTWRWAAPVDLRQVSIGSAGAGHTNRVTVEELRPGGGWSAMASVGGAVGPGSRAPFLLAAGSGPATALRVTVVGQGKATTAQVTALGVPAGG